MPVVLSYNPAGPQFPMSADAVMPRITVTATLQGVTLDPKTPPVCTTAVWPLVRGDNAGGVGLC
jgi:hypothetical protein